MHRLRPLLGFAPILVGACSLINAPAEIDTGTATGGTGGTGAAGGSTTSSSGGSTTTTTSTGTPTGECGDGKVQAGEDCDDDNTKLGDGCDAMCNIEPGFSCTADLGELSICEKLCGNGTIEAGEECDDKGAVDMPNPEGDQDYCTADCKFKEFDIEASTTAGANNELPSIGFRSDQDATSFAVFWHSAALNKVLGRQYKFNGDFAKGSVAVDFATSPSPDAAGLVMCTASSNRSVVAWHDSGDGSIYWRRIESNAMLFPTIPMTIPTAQPRPSCAADPDPHNTFIVATTGKVGGNLWDVYVQPFASSALDNGAPIDIGDTLLPNQTASWPLSKGFMVAWIADPSGGGPLVAQQLDQTGALMPGFFFTLTDAMDIGPREPAAARTKGDQFAFLYTRTSAPDVSGNTHRELMMRMFSAPGSGMAPQAVAPASDVTDQTEPAIAVNPANGHFVVVYTSGPVTNRNVFYRLYNENGVPAGEPVLANTNLPGQQTAAAAVADPVTGNVAVVWDNFVTNSGKPHKVSARIFHELLK